MNMALTRSPVHTKGFTLVEVLIAATLFSFTLTMIFGALHTTSRSWRSGEAQSEINEDYRLGMGFLRKYINQALPITLVDGRENRLLFKGDNETIHFISTLPAHRGGSGLHLLSVVLADGESGKDLIVKYQTVSPEIKIDSNNETDRVESVTLIKGLEDMEINYFGTEEIGDKPYWNDQWQEIKRLPELVSIMLTPMDKNRFIPELLIPIRITEGRGMRHLVINNVENNLSRRPGNE